MSAADDFDRMILEFMNDDPLTAIYHQYTGEVYDPSTSENSSTQVDVPVRGILLDFDRVSNGLSSKFGTVILLGDKEFYMWPVEKFDSNATPIIPNTSKDRITVAGVTYKIEISKSADPTGAAPLLYNFKLQR